MYPIDNWLHRKTGYKFGDPTFYGTAHRGLDLIIAEGTPIFAPFDGEIVRAFLGKQGGYTLWFKPDHDDVIIRFLHLQEMPALTGRMEEGDIMAFSGNTGLSTAPHLHIDISKGSVKLSDFNNFINPSTYNWQTPMRPNIQIQVIRREDPRHQQRITEAISFAYNWFKDRGVDINFDASVGHFQMITATHPTGWNAGSAIWEKRITNVQVGDGDPAEVGGRLDRHIVIHEIQHMMWHQVGLGCMHDCVGEDPDVVPITYTDNGMGKVLDKFLKLYDSSKHFLPINKGGLYLPNTMPTDRQKVEQFVKNFRWAIGLSLSDGVAIKHWTDAIMENGYEAIWSLADITVQDRLKELEQFVT